MSRRAARIDDDDEPRCHGSRTGHGPSAGHRHETMADHDVRPLCHRRPNPRLRSSKSTTEDNPMPFGDFLAFAIMVLPVVLTFALLRAEPLPLEAPAGPPTQYPRPAAWPSPG